MTKKYILTSAILIALAYSNTAKAQATDSTKSNDLFAELEKESKKVDANTIDYTTATFKSTRIVNGHSIETIGKYNLDFRISHRFGYLNSGSYNLFG